MDYKSDNSRPARFPTAVQGYTSVIKPSSHNDDGEFQKKKNVIAPNNHVAALASQARIEAFRLC